MTCISSHLNEVWANFQRAKQWANHAVGSTFAFDAGKLEELRLLSSFPFLVTWSCPLRFPALFGDRNLFMAGNTVMLIKNKELPHPSPFSKCFY